MGEWGPGQKKLADGNILGIYRRFRLSTGDYVHWAECTDGWHSREYTDYNDAEVQFGEHFSKHHGGQ